MSGDSRIKDPYASDPTAVVDAVSRCFADFYASLLADLLNESLPDHLATVVEKVQHADRDSNEPMRAGGGSRLVLIVEANAETRELAVAMLEQTELTVIQMDTAEEALGYLREDAPDVAMILTDVRLAGRLDGIDLARCAAVRWPWILVVVTSDDPCVPFRELPPTAVFLPKPWRALDVLVQVERAISFVRNQEGSKQSVEPP